MPFLERFDVVFDNPDKQGPGFHRILRPRPVVDWFYVLPPLSDFPCEGIALKALSEKEAWSSVTA
jgi:hypothetical protein